jgi:hypothetical protein
MQSYSKITSGTCSSNGLLPITTLNECGKAAAAIGNADTSATTTSRTPRPEGCYDDGHLYDGLYLATDTSNIGNGVDEAHARFPLCRTGTKFRMFFLAYSRLHLFCSLKFYVGPTDTIWAMLS